MDEMILEQKYVKRQLNKEDVDLAFEHLKIDLTLQIDKIQKELMEDGE